MGTALRTLHASFLSVRMKPPQRMFLTFSILSTSSTREITCKYRRVPALGQRVTYEITGIPPMHVPWAFLGSLSSRYVVISVRWPKSWARRQGCPLDALHAFPCLTHVSPETIHRSSIGRTFCCPQRHEGSQTSNGLLFRVGFSRPQIII